jgi:hypothetical protein
VEELRPPDLCWRPHTGLLHRISTVAIVSQCVLGDGSSVWCSHRPLSLRELTPNRPHMSPTALRCASPRNVSPRKLSFSLGGASEQGLPTTPLPPLKGGNARKKNHGPRVGPAGQNAGQNAGRNCRPKMPAKNMSAKTCRHEPAAVFPRSVSRLAAAC